MEEEAYMGAPSQVEKRDTYDGRPGKVVGVYSNIKKQRDMDEGHVEDEEEDEDVIESLPQKLRGARDRTLAHAATARQTLPSRLRARRRGRVAGTDHEPQPSS